MAAKKDDAKTTKLSHSSGTTVVVDSEKAERLVAGGNFAAHSAGARKAARDARRSQLKPSA
jgi:hypothetical protein